MRTASRLFWILIAGACAMAALLALLPAAGHDQMWLLYAAKMRLHGAAFYGPQVFETNPPLILWMSLLPAAMAQGTHVSDTACGKLLVTLLLLAVGWFSLALLQRLRPTMERSTVLSLAFAWIVIFGVMPARDFGQRDYFLGLLVMPYVLLAALRVERMIVPQWMAVAAGAMALCGCALKPHQLLVPVAIEIAVFAMRNEGRWRGILRAEVLAFLAAGCVFLFAIHVGAPLYFSQLVPLARDTYWAYGRQGFLTLLEQAVELCCLLVVLTILFKRREPKMDASGIMFLVAAYAATAAYLIQGTGWYYQQLPALDFAVMALALRSIDIAEAHAWSAPRWSTKAAAALCALAVFLTAHFSGYPFTEARSFPVSTPDPVFFAGLKPGDAVMTISPTIDDTIQPLYRYHLTLGQRYPAFLILPAILRSERAEGEPVKKHLAPSRVAELDAKQHAMMREDLERWQPKLILVERCQDPATRCQVLEDRHDDLLAFFQRDPAFAAIFAKYHFVRTAGAYDGYER